ncbi:MAG: mannose-1-phosphate guanylyltransferase [Muribaculaceae bacterium]|nr:mannose-1-phosphate guanylyltransferase [Muribaculaceae bacterium]
MKIILLSGGSGKRLWPLSNDVRSKQFLQVLETPDGHKESMIQRVVRQIKATGNADGIVVATGEAQKDYVKAQLGNSIGIVTEPCRRDTFPAIALSCSYLASNGTSPEEPVIVMPCDTYADDTYFETVCRMAESVKRGDAELILMGITPTYPSEKFGYIVPKAGAEADGMSIPVERFTEKPDVEKAKKLLAEGALWNGGVFAFRLGYLMDIVKKYMPGKDFEEIHADYEKFPKISFDYEVVEKAKSVGVLPYTGEWKDLGTWNTLTEKLPSMTEGSAKLHDCENTHVVNELGIPVIGLGLKDLVIVVSPEGILVSEKGASEKLKSLL